MSDDDELPIFSLEHPVLSGLLTRLSTNPDARVGVTFLVGGRWIAGTLVSARVYLDTVAALVRRAGGGIAETESFARALEMGASGALDLGQPTTTAFLVDATDVAASTPIGPMTVRLAGVDGFVAQLTVPGVGWCARRLLRSFRAV